MALYGGESRLYILFTKPCSYGYCGGGWRPSRHFLAAVVLGENGYWRKRRNRRPLGGLAAAIWPFTNGPAGVSSWLKAAATCHNAAAISAAVSAGGVAASSAAANRLSYIWRLAAAASLASTCVAYHRLAVTGLRINAAVAATIVAGRRGRLLAFLGNRLSARPCWLAHQPINTGNLESVTTVRLALRHLVNQLAIGFGWPLAAASGLFLRLAIV